MKPTTVWALCLFFDETKRLHPDLPQKNLLQQTALRAAVATKQPYTSQHILTALQKREEQKETTRL